MEKVSVNTNHHEMSTTCRLELCFIYAILPIAKGKAQLKKA